MCAPAKACCLFASYEYASCEYACDSAAAVEEVDVLTALLHPSVTGCDKRRVPGKLSTCK
jgi:hypothetical protein